MMSSENMVSRVLRAPLLIFEFNFTFTYQNSVAVRVLTGTCNLQYGKIEKFLYVTKLKKLCNTKATSFKKLFIYHTKFTPFCAIR